MTRPNKAITNISIVRLIHPFLILLSLGLLTPSVLLADNNVTIVVHYPGGQISEYSDQHAYGPEMVNKIFTSKLKSWPNGLSMQPFVLPSSNKLHNKFVQQIMHSNIYEVQRIWNRLIFSGRGSAPQEVKDEDEMMQKIKQIPGAIGYLPTNKVHLIVTQKENKQ